MAILWTDSVIQIHSSIVLDEPEKIVLPLSLQIVVGVYGSLDISKGRIPISSGHRSRASVGRISSSRSSRVRGRWQRILNNIYYSHLERLILNEVFLFHLIQWGIYSSHDIIIQIQIFSDKNYSVVHVIILQMIIFSQSLLLLALSFGQIQHEEQMLI